MQKKYPELNFVLNGKTIWFKVHFYSLYSSFFFKLIYEKMKKL